MRVLLRLQRRIFLLDHCCGAGVLYALPVRVRVYIEYSTIGILSNLLVLKLMVSFLVKGLNKIITHFVTFVLAISCIPITTKH